jgi:hypothetical protein
LYPNLERAFGHPAYAIGGAEMTKIFEGIVIYGAAWCPDARRARRFLDEHKANYRWIDIDEDNQALELVSKPLTA